MSPNEGMLQESREKRRAGEEDRRGGGSNWTPYEHTENEKTEIKEERENGAVYIEICKSRVKVERERTCLGGWCHSFSSQAEKHKGRVQKLWREEEKLGRR